MTDLAGRQIESFRVERELGRGKHFVYWLGVHEEMGLDAVLQLTLETDHALRARLLNAAQIQASIGGHPNIVGVMDILDVDGSPASVAEYVQGTDLQRVLHAGPVPLDVIDRVARGLLAGLGVTHEFGVTHRNIKPSKVMLDGAGTPMLRGFVFSRHTAGGRPSSVTTIIGTPSHMAPEQFLAPGTIDTRADLWSVGVVLHQLVTGHVPFAGEQPREIFRAVEAGDRRPVTELAHGVPPRMAETIERALVVDRDQRFATAEEMLESWVTPRA